MLCGHVVFVVDEVEHGPAHEQDHTEPQGYVRGDGVAVNRIGLVIARVVFERALLRRGNDAEDLISISRKPTLTTGRKGSMRTTRGYQPNQSC